MKYPHLVFPNLNDSAISMSLKIAWKSSLRLSQNQRYEWVITTFKNQSISARIAFAGTTKFSIFCVDLIALIGFDEPDAPDLLSLSSGREKKTCYSRIFR